MIVFLKEDYQLLAVSLSLMLGGGYFLFLGQDNHSLVGVLMIISGIVFYILNSLSSSRYEHPVLILDDESISFEGWGFKNLPYSEIEKVEFNRPGLIALRVSSRADYLSVSTSDKFFGEENWLNICPGKYVSYTVDLKYLSEIISEKRNSLSTPLGEIVNKKLIETSTKNALSKAKRIFYICVSLAFALFGVLVLAHKIFILTGLLDEHTGTYGLDAILILGGAFSWAAYFALNLFDQYNRNDGKNRYRKIQRYCAHVGTFAAYLFLALFWVQGTKDRICQSNILQMASSEAGLNAFVFERYCAAGDAMKDTRPELGVSVYPVETVQVPNEPPNTAYLRYGYGRTLFGQKKDWEGLFTINNIHWEGKDLFVEYSVIGGKNSLYHLQLKERRPVNTILKKNNLPSQTNKIAGS